MSFKPRPYQELMIEHAIKHPRSALFAGMGMGKTSSTLAVIDIRMLAGTVCKTLIIAPKRVAVTTWPEEAKKWAQFAHLRFSVISGTAEERRRALFTDADIYTIAYDNLVWLFDALDGRWFFDMVVPDEATRVKSFRSKQGGKRAQALSKVARQTPFWTNLTGTPAPNGLADLWGQTWFLDQGFRLGRTFSAFENRWFGIKRMKDAVNPSKFYAERVPFPHSQAEIEAALRDICLTLDPKDWFDLEEPIVRDVFVELPEAARKHYREMEREMFTRLGEHEVEAFGAAAKTIKCLQLANGAAYVGESNEQWHEVHDEKLQALESIIEEAAGAPVLVAYHFKSDLARLRKTFPQGRVLDADPRTIAAWNGGHVPVLFAHPASAGHGLNLQDGGNILAFFGHWWALEERQQIVERIGPVRQKQAGHNRPVFIYNIIARHTVDELVLRRLETKATVQETLLAALKERHGQE